MFEDRTTYCFVEYLKEWQTLIAGLLALLAAIGTIYLLRQQIRQSDKHADNIRSRKSRAARATMPAALSSLMDYLSGCALYGAELRRIAQLNRGEWPTQVLDSELSMPEYPNEIVQVLRDCVEHAEAGPADAVADLLGQLQVLTARLGDLRVNLEGRGPNGSPLVGVAEHANHYVRQAASIYAMTEKLFPYARRESEGSPDAIDGADVSFALLRMGVGEGP